VYALRWIRSRSCVRAFRSVRELQPAVHHTAVGGDEPPWAQLSQLGAEAARAGSEPKHSIERCAALSDVWLLVIGSDGLQECSEPGHISHPDTKQESSDQ